MDGVGEQGGLFEIRGLSDARGFRGPVAANVAGISYLLCPRSGCVRPCQSRRRFFGVDVLVMSCQVLASSFP